LIRLLLSVVAVGQSRFGETSAGRVGAVIVRG